jgi:1,2-phenylacetyl-CoA epoxidase PaaB subunit
MSKVRERTLSPAGELSAPTPDAKQWVVYTQKRKDAPFKWAGTVEAVDTELALQYSREHYGLDEACVGLIAYERDKSVDGEYSIGPLTPSSADGEDGDEWLVFTLAKRGGNHQTAGTVKAPDAATAINRATAAFANGKVCNIRVVPASQVHETTEQKMVIWRTHDMTYKLAKGYSKQVRSKWTRIRDNPAYEQYQKEDIETHF